VSNSPIAASSLSVIGIARYVESIDRSGEPSLNHAVSARPLADAADRFLGQVQSDMSSVTALFSSVDGMPATSAMCLHPAVVLSIVDTPCSPNLLPVWRTSRQYRSALPELYSSKCLSHNYSRRLPRPLKPCCSTSVQQPLSKLHMHFC
jgi:hypothetical protein